MSNQKFWFVGASWNGEDETERFINEGIWKNGYDDKYLDKVNSIQVGDKIAIKSTYTKKNGLEFDSKGNVVSVLAVKVVGEVTENLGDGQTVKVDWAPILNEPREWFFYTYRGTIWEVEPDNGWYAKALCDFAFKGEEQDIQRFRNEPYWVARYGDFSEVEKALGLFLDETVKAKSLKNRKAAAKFIVQSDDWKEIENRQICFNEVGDYFVEQKPDPRKLKGVLQRSKVMPGHGAYGSMMAAFFKHENAVGWISKITPARPITQAEMINEMIDEAVDMGFHDLDGKAKRSEAAFFLSILLTSVYPEEYLQFRQSKVDVLTNELHLPQINDGDYGHRFLQLSQLYRTIYSTAVFQEYFSEYGNSNAIIGGLTWIFADKKDWLYGEGIMPTTNNNEIESENSLNEILYGPPGTGKTYNTVMKAVDICRTEKDNFSSCAEHKDEGNQTGCYECAKKAYKFLKEKGRIEFVTFHQSYGYEEFIEGVRAKSNDGKISYQVEGGIFKRISAQASKSGNIELENFDGVLEKLKELASEQDIEAQTPKGKKELKFSFMGGNSFKIYPASTDKERGTYDYHAYFKDIKAIYLGNKQNNEVHNPSYVQAIIVYMQEHMGLHPYKKSEGKKNTEAFVLIIDEINRGNMSKIFGELITLIEEDKRLGAANEMTVRLPVSGDEFGVPSNLHIIGTMNTADRSIAMMDTALRRRFEFEEMMPDPLLLHVEIVDDQVDDWEAIDSWHFSNKDDDWKWDKDFPGDILIPGDDASGKVNLRRLLYTINQRIEVLYDREHTIGHAYFMGLNSESSIKDLGRVFANKVIPLLAEYFFEDWEKIRLVLGDNQKAESKHQFITEKKNVDYKALFGSQVDDVFTDERKVYERNQKALEYSESYLGIYMKLTASEGS